MSRPYKHTTPALREALELGRISRNRCEVCRRTESIEIHHVIGWKMGGPAEWWNLVVLCKSCHTAAEIHMSELETYLKGKDRRSARRGYIRRLKAAMRASKSASETEGGVK